MRALPDFADPQMPGHNQETDKRWKSDLKFDLGPLSTSVSEVLSLCCQTLAPSLNLVQLDIFPSPKNRIVFSCVCIGRADTYGKETVFLSTEANDT